MDAIMQLVEAHGSVAGFLGAALLAARYAVPRILEELGKYRREHSRAAVRYAVASRIEGSRRMPGTELARMVETAMWPHERPTDGRGGPPPVREPAIPPPRADDGGERAAGPS